MDVLRSDIAVVTSSGFCFFFFSSRRRHTRFDCDWSSDVCSSDLSRASAVPARARNQRSARRERRVELGRGTRYTRRAAGRTRRRVATIVSWERLLDWKWTAFGRPGDRVTRVTPPDGRGETLRLNGALATVSIWNATGASPFRAVSRPV